MSLSEKLESLREASARKFDESKREIMHEATEQLQQTLPDRKIPEEGDPLPEFELPDSTGQMVRSSDLLDKSSLVLAFFRGRW